MSEDKYRAALDAAAKQLSCRALSAKMLRDKLIAKGHDEEAADYALAWLAGRSLLSDAQFAESVVRSYTRRGYGAARIRQELQRRGISREDADAAMDSFSPALPQMLSVLEKRLHGDLSDRKEVDKAVAALQRRGFSWGDIKNALPFACALEMIHTYSLIHDDLPCMDNDDLRRGRPTCHKAFDEATAVLAGDGLLTAAFETASQADVPAETALRCIRILSENAGMNGMIGGQVLDMLAEHRRISETELRLLQKLKTGCLLRAACELGCAAAGKTDTESIEAARAYGDKLGLAFQIEDDILDIEGDEKTLGKSIGKDAASEKSTFPSLLGLDACRKLAGELTEQAVAALTPYEGRAFLETLARSLTGRKS